MNEEERNNLLDKKLEREYQKFKLDVEQDVSQREHWAESRRHWRFQRFIWVIMGVLTGMAIIANAYIKTHPENFMPQPVIEAAKVAERNKVEK